MTSTTVSEHQGERVIERGEALSSSFASESAARDGEVAPQATPAGLSATARVWIDRPRCLIGQPVAIHVTVSNADPTDAALAVTAIDPYTTPSCGSVPIAPWLAVGGARVPGSLSADDVVVPIAIPPLEARTVAFTAVFNAPGRFTVGAVVRFMDFRTADAELATVDVHRPGE